jgi:hypothetical protein
MIYRFWLTGWAQIATSKDETGKACAERGMCFAAVESPAFFD